MSWTDDFSYLLNPVPADLCDYPSNGGSRLGNLIEKHEASGLPDLDGVKLVLLGVKETRRSGWKNIENGCDVIRSKLYGLFPNGMEALPVDLGNIEQGEYPHDTDAAVKQVVGSLLSKKITTIVIGASQELTLALHRAYEVLEVPINICVVDQALDLGEFREDLSPSNYLSKIVLHDPSYLFNLCVLGYQSYYADPESARLMDKLYFDHYRLGDLSENLTRSEPLIRNSDLLSIDMMSVKNDSAPGTGEPNGFNGQELCQITRYAGLSERTSVIGLFNYNVGGDLNGQQAMLIAQSIWYFIRGFQGRVREYPLIGKRNFREFKVQLAKNNEDLVFYKSKRTDKWWMKIPYSVKGSKFTERHHIVPCAYEDYKLASEGEIPDLWWKTYRKLT